MDKTLVYIAGPYRGAVDANVSAAIDWGEQVYRLGMVPLIPHETFLWALKYRHTDDEWLEITAEYLKRCDAMLRIPGASEGADAEAALAELYGMPVFRLLIDLCRWNERGNTC